MKFVAAFVLPLSFLASTVASAAVQTGDELKNNDRPEIKMTIVESTKEGVPTVIGFAKGKEVLGLAKVSANSDAIDGSTGEVYDVKGPQEEGELCAVNAKLSMVGDAIKIDFDDATIGTAFLRGCGDLPGIAGIYKK